MKKLLSTTALIAVLGFASLVSSTFAATTPGEHYNQAVASWKLVSGAKCYNIYYGWVNRKNTPAWNHSVRCLSNNTWQFTIGDLKQGRSYEYTVAALSYSGKEYSWTAIAPLSPVTPMQ